MPVAGDVLLSDRPTDLLFSGSTSARKVVLSPTLSWEQGCVQEPSVWYYGGAWHMTYTGGWGNAGIGYATAPNPQGPWTKNPTPVLGLGYGGMALNVSAHMEFCEDGTVYSYYPSQPGGGDLMVATASATSPASFTTQGVALMHTSAVAAIVNSHLYRRGPGDYVLTFESKAVTAWPQWQIGYATGTSPLGPFTVQTFPLPTLSRGDSTAMYGGPWITKQDDLWVLYYHASKTQNLPTDIYRATSPDLVTWSPTAVPLIRRTLAVEVDQVADFTMAANPSGGPRYAFWSAQDNVKPSGYIVMAVPRMPTLQYDGGQWTQVSPDAPDYSRQVRVSLPSNLSVAGHGGSWFDVPGALLTYTPSRDEVFTLTGSCLTSTALAQSYYVRVGASPTPGGYPNFNAYHEATPAGRVTSDTFPLSGQLDAGVTYSWSLQVQSASALTVYAGSQLSIVTSPR